MGFDFIVEYKRRKDNIVADALSRTDKKEEVSRENHDISKLLPNWVEAVKEEIQSKISLRELLQRVKNGEVIGPWKLQDGVLFFKEKMYLEEDSTLILDIIEQFHNSTHEGFLKTFHRIHANFYWKGMRNRIKAFIRNCDNWVKWLTWAEFCYNTSYHSSIQKTPFEVVYGRAPLSLLAYVPGTVKVASVEHELMERDAVMKEVKERIKEAQARMKHIYESKHKEREFSVGDMVYLKL
ncbi:hypothetical protein AB3S75_017059 [Citrus x aurantiifolia]